MRYLELKIKMSDELLGAVSEALAASGFDEMIINDPADYLEIEEHPEWYKYDYINEELAGQVNAGPEITLYFSDDEEGCAKAAGAERVLSEMQEKMNESGEDICSDIASSGAESGLTWSLQETADDSEWLYKWQEHFKPTRIGEHIVVKPSWEEYDAGADDIVIEMDPGMAFGSGLHETTTLCIKALEKILSDEKTGMKVLDVGTGTGILAIAAMKLGASECLGIDIDEDAVTVARENIERNGLGERISALEGDLMEGVRFDADIIVANLMADLVIRLAPAAADQLKPGGIFISSGILDIKEEAVSEAVRAAGFEITEIGSDGEWRAITAVRK